jgi:hypothetical protein
MKNTVMWVMTPCSEVDLYGRFGGTAINFSRLYGVTCRGRCLLYPLFRSMGIDELQKANLALALKAGQVRRSSCAIF